MSEYRRLRVPGATVFFTVSLAQRGMSTLTDHIDHLRLAVAQTRRERPFTIDAFVVLPDHLHCVWTLPPGDSDYALRWRLIKSRFSRTLPRGPLRRSHIARAERGLWQRRYWEHHIRNDAEYRAQVMYCWNDPIRHGLATHALEWPFSSAHRDLRLGHLL